MNAPLIQRVQRYLNRDKAGVTEVTHDMHTVTPPLTDDAREANYTRQNQGRPLTVAQRRNLRKRSQNKGES